MKKSIPALFLSIFLIFATMVSGQQNQSKETAALATVPSVDLKRYSGKWFEIARYENKFQKQCVGNTTATYVVKVAGKVDVINECLTKNGEIDRAKGEARIVDKKTNAKLEVRFAPTVLSFIPAVWGDYWIIELDDNYQHVVIGDPKRKYFWILSRTPELSDATYQNILRRAEKLGFNPAKVIKTPQKLEAVKGAVVEKS